jgi:hypothetical protein
VGAERIFGHSGKTENVNIKMSHSESFCKKKGRRLGKKSLKCAWREKEGRVQKKDAGTSLELKSFEKLNLEGVRVH